ncbi:MAG: NAD(+) synthase [Deltaproteobacteria bacterium]|nr:NAD(+) synthase [Deltaproteobacteria bacterium]
MKSQAFNAQVLELDCEAEAQRITARLVELLGVFKRRGYVVALSGGIDSSVTAALCVRAVGKERVFGLHMPERDSSSETIELSRSVSTTFGFDSAVEELTPVLDALGCYRRRDEAIRTAIPDYGPGWKSKIVLPNVLEHTGYNYYSVVAQAPDGTQVKKRLPLPGYLGVVAATNFKQRVRKMFEYYHADRLNFATTGTPNRLEYDQGFFVKLGDGAADAKPIAHLYKSQVYMMAAHLGVPEKIRRRAPTTDTYSLQQGQDEFYFSLPYDKMDLCLYAKNNQVPAGEVADALGLTVDQVERVFKDIDAKRATTRYLHLPPQLAVGVPEIGHA